MKKLDSRIAALEKLYLPVNFNDDRIPLSKEDFAMLMEIYYERFSEWLEREPTAEELSVFPLFDMFVGWAVLRVHERCGRFPTREELMEEIKFNDDYERNTQADWIRIHNHREPTEEEITEAVLIVRRSNREGWERNWKNGVRENSGIAGMFRVE